MVDLSDGSSTLALEQVIRAWYAPTGHMVYVRTDGAVFAAPFDLGALELTGAGIPLFEGVRTGAARADMLLGADGTLFYVEGSAAAGEALRLIVVDLEGNEEPLVLAPREIGSVGWSPDGQSVVYSSEDQIYTFNLALGTTPRQLTFEGINVLPVLSPDGTRVAFSSVRDGTLGIDLFVKNLDDDSPPKSIVALDGSELVSQWPSDTLIMFERVEGGPRNLWRANLSDPDSARAEAYLSSEADLHSIVVSPDGTLAAYSRSESGQSEIYIRSFPDPGERTIVSPGRREYPLLVTGWKHPLLLEVLRRRPGRYLGGCPHPAKSGAGSVIHGFAVLDGPLSPPVPRFRSPSGRRPLDRCDERRHRRG